MYYVTLRSYQMTKHKFAVTSPDALFMEIAPDPPEYEKYCIDISHLGSTRMH
jgi:hypothetical protein